MNIEHTLVHMDINEISIKKASYLTAGRPLIMLIINHYTRLSREKL